MESVDVEPDGGPARKPCLDPVDFRGLYQVQEGPQVGNQALCLAAFATFGAAVIFLANLLASETLAMRITLLCVVAYIFLALALWVSDRMHEITLQLTSRINSKPLRRAQILIRHSR